MLHVFHPVSPMTNEVEPLFICYLPSGYLLWWGICSDLLLISELGGLFSFCWFLKDFFLYIFRNKSFIKYMFFKYFLPLCGISLHFLNSVFFRAETFNFNEVKNVTFFFHGSYFGHEYPKTHYQIQETSIFSYDFFYKVYNLQFTFRSVIHLVYNV